MQAIVYDPVQGALLREVAEPEIREDEALLEVEACGLCGSDLLKLNLRPPKAVLGHEVAGRLKKVGRKVKGFKEGDRVVSAHHVPCFSCHYCLHENYSMCRQFKNTNFDPGGFAEFTKLSDLHLRHVVLKIPASLDSVSACMTEPLACAVRLARKLNLKSGDTAAVLGLGAMGLLTAQILKRQKVSVFGLDLDAARAECLSPYGVGFVSGKDLQKITFAHTQCRGLDALIFTAGPPELVSQSLEWVRDGGGIALFAGYHPHKIASLDLNEIYQREISLIGSYSPAPQDLPKALDLLATRAVSLEPLGLRSFPLSEFAEAERAVRSRQLYKAVLVPSLARVSTP